MGRRGLRVCDLMDPETLRDKIATAVADKNRTLEALKYPQTIDPEPIVESYTRYGEKIKGFVTDTSSLLNQMIREGKRVLFEGAQGTLLDVDHGTFPFVTSSSAASGVLPPAIQDIRERRSCRHVADEAEAPLRETTAVRAARCP